MKSNFFKILLFVSIIFWGINTNAQVWVNGVQYPFTATSTGPNFDAGTPLFAFDAAPSLVGGWKYLLRKGGYWYLFHTGIGMSTYNTYYLTARTTAPQTDPLIVGPPDCAEWQLYASPIGSPGFVWTGYPSATPAAPNGSFVTINITGSMVVSGNTGTSTNILPNYIELSNKSSTTIAGFTNQGGRILYNNCENTVMYNNGAAWKSVWPNNLNYDINYNQSFNFGSNNSKIFGRQTFSNPDQLVFTQNNTERIILGKNGSATSQINLNGSISVSTKIISTSYTVTDNDYLIIFSGTTNETVTLPPASGNLGRILIIANNSSNILAVPPFVSFTTKVSKQFVSDGNSWIIIGS